MKTKIQDLQSIPESRFMIAVMPYDFMQAKMGPPKNDKTTVNGEKRDIYLKSITGKIRVVNRKQLTEEFSTIAGKKIKLFGWRKDRVYNIKCTKEKYVMALGIPKGCGVSFGGKTFVNSNEPIKYLIADINGKNGTTELDSMELLSGNVFRKLFYIPRNERNTQFLNMAKPKKNYKKEVVASNEFPKQAMIKQEPLKKRQLPDKDPEKQVILKAEAIATVRSNSKLVGFVVQYNGVTQTLSVNDVSRLCDAGRMSNLTLVRAEGKAPFLRGEGIRIDELPVQNV